MSINPLLPMTVEDINATQVEGRGVDKPDGHYHFFFECPTCLSGNRLGVMYCREAQAISISCRRCDGAVVASIKVATKETRQ